MKKTILSAAIFASFVIFASSASATDNRVTCMGCPTETGNHRDNGLANIQFGGRGGWEGTTGAESMSSGVGNVKNHSENYSFGAQKADISTEVVRSTGLPGTGCSGTCQDNHGQMTFDYKASAGAGAMNESESNTGYGSSKSFTGTGGDHNYQFSMH